MLSITGEESSWHADINLLMQRLSPRDSASDMLLIFSPHHGGVRARREADVSIHQKQKDGETATTKCSTRVRNRVYISYMYKYIYIYMYIHMYKLTRQGPRRPWLLPPMVFSSFSRQDPFKNLWFSLGFCAFPLLHLVFPPPPLYFPVPRAKSLQPSHGTKFNIAGFVLKLLSSIRNKI